MAKRDDFVADPVSPAPSNAKAKTFLPDQDKLSEQLDEINKRYEIDFRFTPGDYKNPFKCKTIFEMMKCLETNPQVGLDAKVLHYDFKNKTGQVKRLKRESFIKVFKNNEKRFIEDDFGGGFGGPDLGLIGQDFIPILGGPFNKQLYLYDMLEQTQAAYWAYNHDPVAHAIIHIICDFVLGKGYRVDFKDPKHDALWEAFRKVNNMDEQDQYFCKELSMYGESMWWALPDHDTQIIWDRDPKQFPIKKGTIPRVRVMDPSQFWDIITHPEDIMFPLAYQWVTPTQYQLYTSVDSQGTHVPGSKFIYRQIPAEQMIHAKINCVSNEKRGRSDLFSVLGYLKRLRDTVNYSIIGMQKSSAWSMDTTIEGNSDDLTAYIQDQSNLGTVAPAGSEFVHTSKVKREYLSNTTSHAGGDPSAFIWCLNMIAAGSRIPISYLGSHLSGGQTRASAVTGTEPVTKLFEMRQQILENNIRKIIDIMMQANGIDDYDAKFTWPEVITTDRSQKLKDIFLCETAEWISPKRAGNMASKELGQDDYDYESEMQDLESEKSFMPPSPLTQPPQAATSPGGGQSGGGSSGGASNLPGKPATSGLGPSKPVKKSSGLSPQEITQVKSNG